MIPFFRKIRKKIKIYSKIFLIPLFILINMDRILAQTTETKLDQVELMKQFIGTWEAEIGDNTIWKLDNKP